eukprot:scaffold2835_cov105-Isochrysis_galbana.AAC.1
MCRVGLAAPGAARPGVIKSRGVPSRAVPLGAMPTRAPLPGPPPLEERVRAARPLSAPKAISPSSGAPANTSPPPEAPSAPVTAMAAPPRVAASRAPATGCPTAGGSHDSTRCTSCSPPVAKGLAASASGMRSSHWVRYQKADAFAKPARSYCPYEDDTRGQSPEGSPRVGVGGGVMVEQGRGLGVQKGWGWGGGEAGARGAGPGWGDAGRRATGHGCGARGARLGSHHRADGVGRAVRRVGVVLGASAVKCLLPAPDGGRVVRDRLTAFVLVPLGVARAALGHEDGLVRERRVAGVELASLAVREALHVDGVRQQVAKREHVAQRWPGAVEPVHHVGEARPAGLPVALAARLIAEGPEHHRRRVAVAPDQGGHVVHKRCRVCEKPVLIDHDDAQPVVQSERGHVGRVVRHAPAVAADGSERLSPEEVDALRHRHADHREVVVVAEAADLKRGVWGGG